jgi:hypothetical protein
MFACSRDIQNADAVRAGVLDYLNARKAQTGLDPNLMQIDVTSVSFARDEAHATVAFRAKSAPDAGGGMVMNYTLDRKGNRWVVRPGAQTGANPHGGSTSMPPPEPPPSQGTLPPGHPPIGSKQQ